MAADCPSLALSFITSAHPATVAMVPPHPGAFIREEIRDEVGLSLSEAAKVLECAALPCPT